MQTEVTCQAGTIVGRERDGMRAFESIPYSHIPAAFDDPAKASNGQLIDASSPRPGTASLSVSTPSGARFGDDLPVMVWIHGGRYEHGDHTDASTDPAGFARAGFVQVRVGYRLKFPGFLPLHTDAPGHYRGVADCAEALNWIQRNIEAFGGDPTNVTVVGHSAGAAIALWLARRDHYKGEFRRVLALSPAFPRAPFESRKWAARGALSTPLTRDALNALYRDRPAKMERAYQRFRTQYITDCAVGPFPHDGSELAEVDIVVSSTREEFITHGTALDRVSLGAAFTSAFGRRMGLKPKAGRGYAREVKRLDATHVAGRLISDAFVRRFVDETCEKAPRRVWQAEFVAAEGFATHSFELPYLFATADPQLHNPLRSWFERFARDGEVGWPEYGRRREAMRVCLGAKQLEGKACELTADPLGYLRGYF